MAFYARLDEARISVRVCMLSARAMLVSNVLDLTLSYLGVLFALVVVYDVLNSRLLDLRK